ncbi:MAG: site-2 protease family protein, partial [Cyanobacteria bacterium NC_groundwater_1444_Ag_S-0.65um_54_12]|nr:site-2 protease family protein [Cyanobacteria bacterium NC_groundwater_1444_Ag_S-0.65um_54_12]
MADDNIFGCDKMVVMPREALSGWTIGRILGIPIVIAPSWVIIAILIFWSLGVAIFPAMAPGVSLAVWGMALAGTILFFASIVAHELSHSLVSRHFGMRVRRIVLFVFGGVSETIQEMPSAAAEFWIAIAGPLCSFGIAGIFAASSVIAGYWGWLPGSIATSWLAAVNLLLGLFNLLPGFPLDGGRILRSLLWAWRGQFLSATRQASWLGEGMAVLLGLWGISRALLFGDWLGLIWLSLLALLLFNAAEASYQQARLLFALRRVPVGDVMRLDVHPLRADALVREAVQEVIARYHDGAYPVADEGQAL